MKPATRRERPYISVTITPSTKPIFFFLNDPATPEFYPLSLHDALPIFPRNPVQGEEEPDLAGGRRLHAARRLRGRGAPQGDPRRHPRCRGIPAMDRALERRTPGWHLRSEEHTSELQSQSNLVCRLLLET